MKYEHAETRLMEILDKEGMTETSFLKMVGVNAKYLSGLFSPQRTLVDYVKLAPGRSPPFDIITKISARLERIPVVFFDCETGQPVEGNVENVTKYVAAVLHSKYQQYGSFLKRIGITRARMKRFRSGEATPDLRELEHLSYHCGLLPLFFANEQEAEDEIEVYHYKFIRGQDPAWGNPPPAIPLRINGFHVSKDKPELVEVYTSHGAYTLSSEEFSQVNALPELHF